MKRNKKKIINNLFDLILTISLLFLAVYQWQTNIFGSIIDIITAIIFFAIASVNDFFNSSIKKNHKSSAEDIDIQNKLAIAQQKTLKFINILSLIAGISLVVLYYTILKYPVIIIIGYINLAYWSICQIVPVIILLVNYSKKWWKISPVL